jgi:hypothetical protein
MFRYILLIIWWVIVDLMVDNVLLWVLALLIGNMTILIYIGSLPYKKVKIFNIRMKL